MSVAGSKRSASVVDGHEIHFRARRKASRVDIDHAVHTEASNATIWVLVQTDVGVSLAAIQLEVIVAGFCVIRPQRGYWHPNVTRLPPRTLTTNTQQNKGHNKPLTKNRKTQQEETKGTVTGIKHG